MSALVKSLSMTSASISRWCSWTNRLRSKVVLPAPRKPVIISKGLMDGIRTKRWPATESWLLSFDLIQHEKQTPSELRGVPYPLVDQMGIENFFTFNKG